MNNTPPEVLEKWRKEAEEFYSKEYCIDKNADPDQDSYYADQFLDLKVNAFIDGRQTAVIELPKPDVDAYFNHFFDGEVSMNSKCKLAIESQGYRVEVKGE